MLSEGGREPRWGERRISPAPGRAACVCVCQENGDLGGGGEVTVAGRGEARGGAGRGWAQRAWRARGGVGGERGGGGAGRREVTVGAARGGGRGRRARGGGGCEGARVLSAPCWPARARAPARWES